MSVTFFYFLFYHAVFSVLHIFHLHDIVFINRQSLLPTCSKHSSCTSVAAVTTESYYCMW